MLNFEEFIEETWDYVSETVVSDEMWNNNQESIRELTFEMFQIYQKNIDVLKDGSVIYHMSPKICGKMIEIFFNNIQTYDFKF